jgi:hypothetical protein
MKKQKRSLKKALITNVCLLLIIALVYVAAFMPFGSLLPAAGPALKGSTGKNVVGLQIIVDDQTNIAAYIVLLEMYGVKGTFFFSEQQTEALESAMLTVIQRGHGVGYYINERTRASALYIGGGYSIPVMNCAQGDAVREVCPSIDVSKLSLCSGWTSALADSLAGDMFLCIRADNNFEEFEKTVQIVLDKGYTILKVNEML